MTLLQPLALFLVAAFSGCGAQPPPSAEESPCPAPEPLAARRPPLERPVATDGWFTVSAAAYSISVIDRGETIILDGGDYGATAANRADVQVDGDTVRLREGGSYTVVRNGRVAMTGAPASSPEDVRESNATTLTCPGNCSCGCTQCVFPIFQEYCCACTQNHLGLCFLAWGCTCHGC